MDMLYRPDMISLVATSVTSVIGLDLYGIVEELQPKVNAKLLAFPGGGFRGDYSQGIKEVFCVLAKYMVAESAIKGSRSVNIIGPTIDSFNHPSDYAELVRLLGLSVPQTLVAAELKKYGHTLVELTSRWQQHKHLKVVISCPYDYAVGLTQFICKEWELEVAMVSLPTAPEASNAEDVFASLGVSRVLITPTVKELNAALADIKPHILFGNSYEFQIAPEVPIRIHAAIPAYDYINLFDGTPFVGFRGNLFLT